MVFLDVKTAYSTLTRHRWPIQLLLVYSSTQTASGCSRLCGVFLIFKFLCRICISGGGGGDGDDAVTDNSVLLNVNIVDESISGCNDVYLTCRHFSDVSA